MRRCIDIVVSFASLVIAAPVFSLVALVILLKEGRPVFFVQQRAGLRGVPFPMFKFRTMRVDAEKSGGTLTFRADSRITSFGRFLRRCKLDELPQLLNILRGEMTLIGPRPEVLDWVERYTDAQREVLKAKPGLTDPVQLFFRHEQDYLSSPAEYEKLFQIKVQQQIEYLRRRTFFSDLQVALKTALTIFPSRPSRAETAIYSEIKAGLEKV